MQGLFLVFFSFFFSSDRASFMALTALLLRTALILAGRGKSRGGSEIHTHTALVGKPASFSALLMN
jgi:hypothetical protein